MAYARHQFLLDRRAADGIRYRDHYAAAAKQGNPFAVAKLHGPPFPIRHAWLWSVFAELSQARTSNGFGLNPISYTDIDAYRRVTSQRLKPWHVRVIRAIDDAFLQEQVEATKIMTKTEQPKHDA